MHALSLADMLRHTGFTDGDRLLDCFSVINQAFRTVRNDPEASLFGFDQYGQVWIRTRQPTTASENSGSSCSTDQPPTAGEPALATTGPALAEFTPPHLGPSEDVRQHAPALVGVAL